MLNLWEDCVCPLLILYLYGSVGKIGSHSKILVDKANPMPVERWHLLENDISLVGWAETPGKHTIERSP